MRFVMFKLSFNTDNDAFNQDYKQEEAARCLEDYVVKQLRNGFASGTILDSNGNKIGSFNLT
jgi:hypothetical protein